MENNTKNNQKNNKKKIAIIILGLLFVNVLGLFLYNNYHEYTVSKGVLTGRIGNIPGMTPEQLQEQLQKEADASQFSFSINSSPIFNDGKSEGNLRIANPPYNTYVIKVIIKLDSNDKVIFESGKIEPNHYIEYAKLNKNLDAGEHKATATIEAYNDKNEYLGKAEAGLNIKVLN